MDDITDERLREISQGATIYGHERNAIAAELLAARARIAKLEQEPPMALVDFGVGVNWKGLREDMQRLRAERDALRAQLHADDQRAWETLGKPEGTHDTTNVQRLCAEVERLRGIIDDIEVESGHCHFLDDEEHEPPHLPDHVRAIVQERDAARAEVASLREGQEELARAVKFLDMCNKERIASGDTGAMSDAWQWVEEAAREMIDAAKETP